MIWAISLEYESDTGSISALRPHASGLITVSDIEPVSLEYKSDIAFIQQFNNIKSEVGREQQCACGHLCALYISHYVCMLSIVMKSVSLRITGDALTDVITRNKSTCLILTSTAFLICRLIFHNNLPQRLFPSLHPCKTFSKSSYDFPRPQPEGPISLWIYMKETKTLNCLNEKS